MTKQSWSFFLLFYFFFSVASLSLTPHVGNIKNTDQLADSEILCKEGCQNLVLAVAPAPLLVGAVILAPPLSALLFT